MLQIDDVIASLRGTSRTRLQLGHVVSIAVDCALRPNEDRQCRKAALATLLALWRAVNDSETLSCFFPGVVTGLGRLAATCEVIDRRLSTVFSAPTNQFKLISTLILV